MDRFVQRLLTAPERFWAASLTLVIAVYAGISLFQVALPGVYYDEVILVNQAFDVLAGRFPIFGNVPYVGALKAYVHAPFVALFGGSVPALRGLPVAITAGTGVVLYSLVHVVLRSRSLALLTVLLFLLHPTVLFSTRMDDGPVSTLMFIEAAVLLLVARAVTERRPGYLLAGGLAAAVGCWQKTYFIWLLIAGIPVLLAYARAIHGRRRLLWLAGFGLIGCVPLLAVLLTSGARVPVGGWTRVDPGSVPAKAVFLLRTFSGQAGAEWLTGRSLTVPSPFPLLVAAAVAIAFVSQPSPARRLLRATGAVTCVIALQTTLMAASGLAVRHYALLFPLAPLIVVGGLAAAPRSGRKVLAGLAAVTLVTNVAALASYHALLRTTGGAKVWSDAIYDLADLARTHPEHAYVALDWGISEPIRYLTNDAIRVREEPWVYPEVERPKAEAVVSLLRNPAARFLAHGRDSEVFRQGREILLDSASNAALAVVVERQFLDRSGREVLEVLRVARRGG